MGQVVCRGKIVSDFLGFRDRAIFKMEDGTYWVQAKLRFWNHFEHHPEAVIEEKNGEYILTVGKKSVAVKQAENVVDSHIVGEFLGWADGRKYKLANGQIWKQIEFLYKTFHTYNPKVLICKVNGREIMYLEGTRVFVKRLEEGEA